jgi:hypothetical protein
MLKPQSTIRKIFQSPSPNTAVSQSVIFSYWLQDGRHGFVLNEISPHLTKYLSQTGLSALPKENDFLYEKLLFSEM